MLQTIINQFLDSEITTLSSIFKMLLSLALGGAIGYERKRKGQIAGVRTFALISMGATLAMILSIYVPQEYLGLKNGDPARIAAQVITGIGFLGAGAIIQMKGSVRGLTTAAGIWMAAAIGMSVGVGMYVIAIVSTLLILATLILFERYERRINLVRETKFLRVVVSGGMPDIVPYKQLLKRHHIHLMDEFADVDYRQDTATLSFVILLRDQCDYRELLDEIAAINNTLSISLSNEQ
ncbi:MAG: MgtC/SapB family protein [Muribaculaceae bacterium]